jgi:hypothetical protein
VRVGVEAYGTRLLEGTKHVRGFESGARAGRLLRCEKEVGFQIITYM